MRDWQKDAPLVIERVHRENPDATPAELKKALRNEARSFAMGTSWGKKVWSKHCKTYLARMTGGRVSPAVAWSADISFPFRDPPHDQGTRHDQH